MKIAIFGSGGVGGYFGARFAAAGEDVHFVARGGHLEAIRRHGLQVRSDLGNVHIDPAQATDDPATVGAADLVLVAVKLYDMDQAARACAPLVGPDSTVVSFQNGVTAVDTLAASFGRDRVIGGATYILSVIEAPGVIAHKGAFAKLIFGETDGARTARVEALLEACRRADIEAAISDNIAGDIWSKFAILASLSGMTALTRLPLGPIRTDPDTGAMLREAVAEVVAVANARGVGLPADAFDKAMAGLDSLPDAMSSSLRHDLENGSRLELDWLSGAVCRLGRDSGVATPTHDVIRTALKLHAAGRGE